MNLFPGEESLTLQSISYYDYNDMVDHVAKKYDINERDFAGRYGKPNNPDVPYQDFWHFLTDGQFSAFNRGAPTHINWQEVYEDAVDENGEDSWQATIAKYYVNEFGDKDYTIVID